MEQGSFVLQTIRSACLSLSLSAADHIASKSWLQTFWSYGARRYFPQWVGPCCNSLPGHRQTSLQGWQNSSSEDLVQGDLYPHQVPGGRVCPWLDLQISKTAGWITTWHCRNKPRLSRSKCWPLQVPPSFSIMGRLPVFESYRFPCSPMVQDQSRSSHKSTHNAEGGWMLCPLGSFFPNKGTGGSGETSLHGAMLAWGWGNVVNM